MSVKSVRDSMNERSPIIEASFTASLPYSRDAAPWCGKLCHSLQFFRARRGGTIFFMRNEPLSEIIANCDQEPIHALGLIQPHGALLCLDQRGRVLAMSTNAPALLGPLPVLGEPLTDGHLTPLSRQTLLAALA